MTPPPLRHDLVLQDSGNGDRILRWNDSRDVRTSYEGCVKRRVHEDDILHSNELVL